MTVFFYFVFYLTLLQHSTHRIVVTKCVDCVFPPIPCNSVTPLDVLQLNSFLTVSIWSYITRMPHPPLCMTIESPGYYDPPAINKRFPPPPPWVILICQRTSQSSGKQFTYWITSLLLKRYYSETAREKMCIEQGGWERAQSFHTLPRCYLPSPSLCAPTQKLSKLHCLRFLWNLHHIGMIDHIIGHWVLIQSPASLPFSEVRSWG